MTVRCEVFVRTPTAQAGLFDYTRVNLSAPQGDGCLHTDHPPVVDDGVFLWDQEADGPRGNFVVIRRFWTHVQYGSVSWPLLAGRPEHDGTLALVTEEAPHPFADEAPRSFDDD